MKLRLYLLIFIVLVYAVPQEIHAADWEYYFECKAEIYVKKESGLLLSVKELARVREDNLYFRKSIVGIKKEIGNNLELSCLYALNEFKADNWENMYTIWPEIEYRYRFGRVELNSETKFERHITNEFWKFREKLRIFYSLSDNIILWTGYEFRHSIDKNYPLDYEYFIGVESKIYKTLYVNTYYDLRKIRTFGTRERTNCLRIAFNFMI